MRQIAALTEEARSGTVARFTMFVFGHVGFTWGGAVLAAELCHRLGPAPARLAAGLDCRFLIAGSMLPDLIDKPLGVFIFAEEVGDGRFLGHSLAFLLALSLAALARRAGAGRALGPLAAGSAVHLALDRLWRDPDTLLWPLTGWRPQREDVSGWLREMIEQLSSDPYTYVSEAVGAALVVGLVALVLAGPGLRSFLREGRMGPYGLWPGGGRLGARQEGPQELQGGEGTAER